MIAGSLYMLMGKKRREKREESGGVK